MQEIARRANVSIATVSRTVNRLPSVDPILARRVRKVIEQEGYFPNTHARALVSGRRSTALAPARLKESAAGKREDEHAGPNDGNRNQRRYSRK